MMANKQDVRDRGGSPSPEQEVPDAGLETEKTPEQSTEQPVEQAQPQKRKEKEKVKEAEKQVDTGEASQKTSPPPPPPSKIMTDEELVADLRHVMSLDKPKQVKVLVYLSFKKGVHHALHIAKKLKDPYLLDEFHDTLVDELYDLLIKKKKIKKSK